MESILRVNFVIAHFLLVFHGKTISSMLMDKLFL
ncbi:hypothetical protein O166_11045 [Pseudogulbenkiania ferrooxidans EGD-HP2]|uniref:Transposase n=1 Tax=Pseudogulbenkiania ferrooxidans EGD-HP2 TaxID=1388764 RepID=A0ABN0N557_9NEIS|nr:hypothetical protein O166_11045 [Pseudogulbenkiania ferrooxidans EGD-HP2]